MKSVLNNHRHRRLDETALDSIRKSDTVFIFGSGSSINDISAVDWAYFESHDTLSFNWFIHQDRVRIDVHLVRELVADDFDSAIWRPQIEHYATLLRDNPHYANAVFVIQSGWHAINGNRLIGMRLLPSGARVFRYHNRPRSLRRELSSSFKEGLAHSGSTLAECVNLAFIWGWRRIVLVGVDLYDRRYFWLRSDETRDHDTARGASHEDRHNTADELVATLSDWHADLSSRGVELYVYNPKSLLAQVLPVFDRSHILRGQKEGVNP